MTFFELLKKSICNVLKSSISQSATSPNVKNFSFAGTFLGSFTDGKTQVVEGETLQFTMEIVQLNPSVLEGAYLLGDTNDDELR